MTFTEIQTAVADRLNLSSTDALTRIARNINARYRRLTSSIGLATSRRGTATVNTVAANPRVTFSLEKLEVVYAVDGTRRRVLHERTYDEWRNADTWRPLSGEPEWYAIEEAGAASVTIVLYPTPSDVQELSADGMENASTLSGTDVPAFPADFHDALEFGAVADEYAKLEKPTQAQQFEVQYEQRVSDLRFFLAKSAYLAVHQGPRTSMNFPYRGRNQWWP